MITAGADIGGTSLRLRIEAPDGSVRTARRAWGDAPRTPGQLALLLREMIAESGIGNAGNIALGLAIAGQVDREGTVVRNAPNLGWRDVPLLDLLSRELVPGLHRLVLINDLHAAALAEAGSGAAAGARTALVVFVGTGIGAALVLDGTLHRGASGAAGELGHTKVQGQDARCGCGARGCVEALVGGRALEALLRGRLPGATAVHRPLGLWQQAVDNGCPDALQLLQERTSMLGRIVAGAATLVSPDVLVLGGGVLQAVPSFHDNLVQAIERDVLAVSGETMRIEMARHGGDAGTIGALMAITGTGRAMAT